MCQIIKHRYTKTLIAMAIKILTDGPPPTMHTSLCSSGDTLSSSSSTDSIGIEKKSSSSAYVCRLGFLVESLPCAPLNDASSKIEKIKILEDIVVTIVCCCCLLAIYVMIS